MTYFGHPAIMTAYGYIIVCTRRKSTHPGNGIVFWKICHRPLKWKEVMRGRSFT